MRWYVKCELECCLPPLRCFAANCKVISWGPAEVYFLLYVLIEAARQWLSFCFSRCVTGLLHHSDLPIQLRCFQLTRTLISHQRLLLGCIPSNPVVSKQSGVDTLNVAVMKYLELSHLTEVHSLLIFPYLMVEFPVHASDGWFYTILYIMLASCHTGRPVETRVHRYLPPNLLSSKWVDQCST